MAETTDTPIVVSQNAGTIDTLTAAGRYLVVVIGAVPLLLKLLGARDFASIVAYLRAEDGVAFTTAAGALIALIYGLIKTKKRGTQVATVAADPRVPDRVASLK